MEVKVGEVQTDQQWKEFVHLPWSLYPLSPQAPYWVPPLQIAVLDSFNPEKNPFFKHAAVKAWVAYQSGKPVGRIVGTVDRAHNAFHSEKAVFFGFFESISDFQVASLLLNTVAEWGQAQGMALLRGPIHFSTNHECGLLIEGFDDLPTVMMPYQLSYYQGLLEQAGLKKVKDLFAYSVYGNRKVSDRLTRHAQRLKQKSDLRIRSFNSKRFAEEARLVFDIYQEAWATNWGFVPMEWEEFFALAKDLKFIYDPRLCLIAELKGEVIGFGLCLPDVNQALQAVKNGKIFSFGFLKFLWNFKGPGRKATVNRCRIITLGIKKQYQELGVGPILYTEYLTRGPALGYPMGEASWILEDNQPMNQALKLMAGDRTKVYRIYERALEIR